MAFKFTELNVTLNAFFDKNDNNAPRAELKVHTCGGDSLVLQFGTCGTDTQRPCKTHPGEMKLLTCGTDTQRLCKTHPEEMNLLPPSTANIEALQHQLREMLERFVSAGIAAQNTPPAAAKKPAKKAAKKPAKATATKATKATKKPAK